MKSCGDIGTGDSETHYIVMEDKDERLRAYLYVTPANAKVTWAAHVVVERKYIDLQTSPNLRTEQLGKWMWMPDEAAAATNILGDALAMDTLTGREANRAAWHLFWLGFVMPKGAMDRAPVALFPKTQAMYKQLVEGDERISSFCYQSP